MDSCLPRLGRGQPRVATSHLAASSAPLDRDKSSQQNPALLHPRPLHELFSVAPFPLLILSLTL